MDRIFFLSYGMFVEYSRQVEVGLTTVVSLMRLGGHSDTIMVAINP